MTSCEVLHARFDAIASGPLRVGELPESFHLRGRMAWYVYQGPYRELSERGLARCHAEGSVVRREASRPSGRSVRVKSRGPRG